jgi:hypothetical protein
VTVESDSGREFPTTGGIDMIRIGNVSVKCSVFASSSFFRASAMSCFSAILAPLVMLLRHNGRSYAMDSQEFVSILKRFNKTLRESLKRFFFPPSERLPVLSSP